MPLNPVFCRSVLEATVNLVKTYRKKYVNDLLWERSRTALSMLNLVQNVSLGRHNTRSVANRSAVRANYGYVLALIEISCSLIQGLFLVILQQ